MVGEFGSILAMNFGKIHGSLAWIKTPVQKIKKIDLRLAYPI